MGTSSGTFREVRHDVDVCVIGGGMAGLCAALAAARHGARVAVMHDRPVPGGNASSETRIHISGADRNAKIPNMRETGILEEVRLENLYRNPNSNFSIWDLVLYDKVRYQPNVTLLLNCSCQDAEMDGSRIQAVTGRQLTTETLHRVTASIFADCSGDGILAPLTGAPFRMGREGRDEYGESIAPEQADDRTMGMTCHFMAREHDSAQPFEPPSWACRFESDEDLPYGAKGHDWWEVGFWWIELGGEHDSIHDTEFLRDELLKIALGVWDHIKNRGDHGAENWAIDWLQFLPAKRESRRYIGDHVLTQGEVEAGGTFDDVVAYGGWPMDDHHPSGFWSARRGHPATIFHPTPSPYGIPYRSLYSRDVDNLMFAGRCASCTHAAMSSTRVMGTASVMGQAVGTVAAIAVRQGISPRGVGERMEELQQALLRDDCYLPNVALEMSPLTANAELIASHGDAEPVRDGIHRPAGRELHGWPCRPGDHLAYLFDKPSIVRGAVLVLDSALNNRISPSYNGAFSDLTSVPDVMPRSFRLDGLRNGTWTSLVQVSDNHQRFVRLPLEEETEGIRFVLERTWGGDQTCVFAFYVH